MMIDYEKNEEPILPDEEIARIIFAPSMIRNGKVSPSAFYLQNLPKGKETYVSVWRTKLRMPTPENANFPPRKPGDNLAGFATIQVANCENQSSSEYKSKVKPHPSRNNPAHAGIHYQQGEKPVKGECYDPGMMLLAMRIANHCILVLF